MIFIRHGHAAPGEFGIDLLRPLSEQGRKQVEEVILPTTFSDVFISPAQRTLDTANSIIMNSNKKAGMNRIRQTFTLPVLYAPILLPEMDRMYQQYGEDVRSYVNDKDIANTMKLTQQAATILRQFGDPSSLVVAHGLILNLIAFHIYGLDKVLDINLGTAKGFWVKNEHEIVEF